jgi:hypothetical protein
MKIRDVSILEIATDSKRFTNLAIPVQQDDPQRRLFLGRKTRHRTDTFLRKPFTIRRLWPGMRKENEGNI